MPKMKTKSSAKKRFRVTASGKIKVKQSKMRHMQMNKPKSMKRKAKGMTTMSEPDARKVMRNYLPYKRKSKSAPKAAQTQEA
ncbi:MAG: 50S ribosomal protein L35 [Micavibrio sp.]|nr:50S ribosomal protein L35 [Micavibrio sp.]|tara:strand:+ start:336 stop:581 length:246 start_codon:yes stop_codon:yes gene_type:complete